MQLALTQAALVRQRQQVAKDVFTLLTSLSEWTVMTAEPEVAEAIERLAQFAKTGDKDADALLETFTGLRKDQALQARAEAGRLARITESERHETWCIAHRCRLRWHPAPAWWYHYPPRDGIPEQSLCPAMLMASAPRRAS